MDFLDSIESASNIYDSYTAFTGSRKAKKIAKHQQSTYLYEASLNRQIGEFNAEIIDVMGQETVTGIAYETRRILGEQRASFSGRGITMEGSPMFVMGNTQTMGSKKAQEASFNSQVNKMNTLYAAERASANAMSRAESAQMQAKSAQMDTNRQLIGQFKNLKSGVGAIKDVANVASFITGSGSKVVSGFLNLLGM